ncbi:MAG TPA: aminotransferase class I/II-fold pyridoxal phosphate-dependent enzyme [Stellaceae bacterium]|nr:aminotransferase class I/II-fold pyridoxal phosphate-dependent enzyme [Stellaceae bacterium]
MVLKVSRRGQVPPFIVMDVMREADTLAAAGADILHLEVGQPSTPAPKPVLDAARAALTRELLGYTDALGLRRLREAVAAHYRHTYGVTVEAKRVVITSGSSGAFQLAFLAAFEVGERVAMAEPSYPGYRNILTALGLEPVILKSGPSRHFQASLAALDEVKGPIHGLIVASPANPTGTMLSASELASLAEAARERGIRLISDEIYHGITYGKSAATALHADADAIVINSFSKYFSMTGWRLGWMIVPEDLHRAVECLAQNLFISPSALSQHAAIAAFDCRDELQANVARYAGNRALLLERLPTLGLGHLAPADGAFYLYADIAHLTDDSEKFCRRMLNETGIACTPGIDFDPVHGKTALRFSYAGSRETIDAALRRLEGWQGLR